jgi:hypothetical protein
MMLANWFQQGISVRGGGGLKISINENIKKNVKESHLQERMHESWLVK